MYEVLIAGAGPAGCATAAGLVRADPGLRGRILVVDRARFPRPKPCGGGLTGHVDEALAAVGLELAVASLSSPRAVVRHGGFERLVALPRPVKVVRREEFDHSLVLQVRDLGIEVRESCPLDGFSVDVGRVRAQVGGEPVEARVLVGADGVGSRVRKALVGHREQVSPQPIRLFRAEISAAASPRLSGAETMLYDFTPMVDGLRGYLWIFPVPGGRWNVGLMHWPSGRAEERRSGAELTALLGARLRELDVELDATAVRGWPAWGYDPRTPVAAPHLLTVGDAAGIDALTGEGIAVGLEQGAVAARAVVAARASGDFSFAGYRRALRRATVGRELALDRWLARLLYGSRRHTRWLSLVLQDPAVLELYAARVAGTLVLADHKLALLRALARHVWLGPARWRALDRAAPSPLASLAPGRP